MADTNQNLVNFRLTGTLSTSGTTVNVSNDIIRDTAIAITDASITLTNEARTSFELVVGTIASGVLTLSKRGVTQAQTLTEDANLKKEWRAGTIGYVTLFASDTLDIDVAGGLATIKNDITFTGDNTFSGTSDFNAGVTIDNKLKIPTFADTTARDVVYTSPVAGNECLVTGVGKQVYDGGIWNTLDVGTPTPDATQAVSGKIELATDAEVTAGTATGGTGASLVLTPVQQKKSISLKTAGTTFGDTDEIAVNISGEDKRITGANLRESIPASTTLKGTVEMATDAEVVTGTDQTRYVNSKQVKDNYGQSGNINGTSVTFTTTSANSGTLTIALGASNVKTVFLGGYIFLSTFSSPTYTRRGRYFAGYFKLTGSGIDLNPISNYVDDSNTNTDPSTLTNVGTFGITTSGSKITSLSTSALSASTGSITGVYVSGTDLKIDYSLGATSGPNGQITGVFIGPVTIIN